MQGQTFLLFRGFAVRRVRPAVSVQAAARGFLVRRRRDRGVLRPAPRVPRGGRSYAPGSSDEAWDNRRRRRWFRRREEGADRTKFQLRNPTIERQYDNMWGVFFASSQWDINGEGGAAAP